jgi:hypothetical protein
MTLRLPLLTLLFLASTAHAGSLVTRDGQTLAGAVRLAGQQVTVTTDAGPRAFPLASVVSADFKTAANAAARPGHGLRGEYFRGKTLKRLFLTRTDPQIDYAWTQVFPHPALVQWGREFSVRWTGQLRPDHSERYTLIVNADDGVRVWIGGQLVIDHWRDQAGGDLTADVLLEKDRKYDLVVEYYNGPGEARATLSWSSPSTPREVIPADNLYPPAPTTSPAATQAITIKTPSTDNGPAFDRILLPDGSGLKAEYFADRELEHLNLTRFDPNVDANYYPDTPPDPAVSPEGSIRWTGMIEPRYTEPYRFHAQAQRRVRLWINEQLVIDQWRGEGGEFTSEPITLTAGRRVSFRVEYSSPNGFILCRLRWSSKSQPRDIIPPDAFSIAPDEKLGRPVLGLVYPAGDAFVAAPQRIALHGTGLSPNGRITRWQFFNGNAPIAEFNAQPFRFVWDKPQPGVYKLRAKLTDAAGVTARSDFSTLTVTGKGDGSVKAPWGDFYIANNELRIPGTSSQTGPGAFKIDKAIGTLVSDTEPDAGQVVIQPLVGDGQVIARVTSVEPGNDDGIAGAMAGITIRENLKNRCKQYSLLYGQPGEEPVAQFARRQEQWMNPVASERPMKIPTGADHDKDEGTRPERAERVEGVWFKLARHGQRVYAYTSNDGKDWDLFASERFDGAPEAFVGLVAFSRDGNKPATATFDHVRVIPGAPALESSAKGFLTRGGTFVAADVYAIDDDFVRYTRNHTGAKIPVGEVARVLFKPLLSDHAEKLSPGRTGVLMSGGDFLEGDVRTLKDGQASISSVLFGLRRVPLNDDLTAIILHDVSPEKTPYTLTTLDGSTYRAKSLTADAQAVKVEDASLGQVSIPLGTLSQLRAP